MSSKSVFHLLRTGYAIYIVPQFGVAASVCVSEVCRLCVYWKSVGFPLWGLPRGALVAGQCGDKADGHMPHTDLSAVGTVKPTKPEQRRELHFHVDPVKTQNNSMVIASEQPQRRVMYLINHV